MSLAGVSPLAAEVKVLAHGADHALSDLRFRALLSDEKWDQLPWRIRRRFSKRLSAGDTAIYIGEIVEAYLSKAGWLLAHGLRLIGGPLPTSRDVNVSTVVSVTEDMRTGGQIWTRLYARRKGFPQIIHSAKRFEGSTGLEEYIGFGIGMRLREAQLRENAPHLIVDVSGPFQSYGEDRYSLVKAAIAAGIDYIDLADGSEFVKGIGRVDREAKARGIFVLSGVSTFPVLTAAVVKELAKDMTNIEAVTGGIAPSPAAGVR